MGNLHKNGGIVGLEKIDENTFLWVADIEGWEYVSPPITSEETKRAFLEINKKTKYVDGDVDTSFVIPQNCNLINTYRAEYAFVLFSQHQHVIINRNATRHHIEELLTLSK